MVQGGFLENLPIVDQNLCNFDKKLFFQSFFKFFRGLLLEFFKNTVLP